MDDVANEWSSPTRELTRNNLASLVRSSRRTARVASLPAPGQPPPIPQAALAAPKKVVDLRPPVYPMHPSSPTLARLGLLALVVLIVGAASYALLG